MMYFCYELVILVNQSPAAVTHIVSVHRRGITVTVSYNFIIYSKKLALY